MNYDKVYTLENIENINFSSYDFRLSDDVVSIINTLETKVSSPSYSRTPNFKKKKFDSEWGSIRNFKVTKILDVKSCMDELFNQLRESLNKLTKDNFDNNSKKIIDKISEFDVNSENITQICNLIFDTSSKNGFYSEVYANLCKKLIEKYPIMNLIIKDEFEKYKVMFDNINYVDPNVDYDEFCKNNKENETRMSIGKFFTNLMNNNIISYEKIYELVLTLQNNLYNNQNDIDERKKNDMYVENISNIIQVGHEKLKQHPNWELIYKKIEYLSNIDTKKHKGISSKCVFTYMDILEYLNK